MSRGEAGPVAAMAPSAAEVEALARSLGLRPLTARLLLNRAIRDLGAARRFLDPKLADLRSPEGGAAMAGFSRAVDRLLRARDAGETIGVFGDYDADGVTTCALLTRTLRDTGFRVVARVARRDAGYGFGIADADAFADAGCAVVITGDCGTSDIEAIAHATAHGSDVIVVDHHQVPDRDPGAFALINPHQSGCAFPFKGLASVGVGFYVACALRSRLRERGHEAPDPRSLLDLVALGTIGDLAPLTLENRILVTAGLKELARGRRAGLRALSAKAGLVAGAAVSATQVSFRLAPRLNAPGRLGDAAVALDLLLAESDGEAERHAAACEELNSRRRELQEQVHAAALAEVERSCDPARDGAIVVAGDGWPHGVVGIVAAKLVDRFAVPAIVIALDGGIGRGSARSADGVDLYRALSRCRDHLVRYGGHAQAAGLTVERERLPALRAALQAAARELRGGEGSSARVVDAEVGLVEIDEALADELARLAPFGIGNPEPLLLVRGLTVQRSRVVGERHLQLRLQQGSVAHDGIAFGFGDRDPGVGSRVRAAFVPEIDTFRGERRLRLRVQQLDEEL